jgi:hypothetical protein
MIIIQLVEDHIFYVEIIEFEFFYLFISKDNFLKLYNLLEKNSPSID